MSDEASKAKLQIYKETIDVVAHFDSWPHPREQPENKAPDGFIWRQNAMYGAGWFLEETGPYSMGRIIDGTDWWYRRKALKLFAESGIKSV